MKYTILTLILLLFSFLSLPYHYKTNSDTLSSDYSVLFPVKQNNKWGYIDKFGRIVIEPKYSTAKPFSEGIAFVQTTKYIKAIDLSGSTLFRLPLSSSFPGFFSNGLSPILINNKYGFIDKTGKLVIEPTFDFAESFSEDLALIKIKGKYGFINKEGKTVIEPIFDFATSFFDGLAAIKINKSDKNPLFVNQKQKIFCYLPNPSSKSFTKKVSTLENYSDLLNNLPSIFDNLNNNFNAKISFETCGFSEDLVSVRVNNLYGYLNTEGKISIEPQFSYADAFRDGLAKVSIKGKCAFINKSGTILINTPYDYYNCSCFTNGLAKIQVGSQIGYIDKDGQFVWPLTN